MEQISLAAEVILSHSHQSLGTIQMDWSPQPGAYIDFAGQIYTILERRHRYQLKAGKYQLQKISLYVQVAQHPLERSWLEGRWVLGDVRCRFNARSEMIRCAVNPYGPCDRCPFYEVSFDLEY
jgi:hypothetical protein